MKPKELYAQYKSHMPLSEYLKEMGDKTRYKQTALLAQGTCLSMFQHMQSTDSVCRIKANVIEPLFERVLLDAFAECIKNHPSWADAIPHQLKRREGWADETGAALWYTLAEVKSYSYHDGLEEDSSEEDSSEEDSSEDSNEQFRAHIGETLTGLRQRFKLPDWRRISLHVDKETAAAEPEYPGWLLQFAAGMTTFEQSAKKAEAKAQTGWKRRLVVD